MELKSKEQVLETMGPQELLNYTKTLRQENQELHKIDKSRYGILFERKAEKVEEKMQLKYPILKEDISKKIFNGEDQTNNILIEGDNLHTLTVLQYTHKEQIDVIYIDPPYNTGKKDFKFNDEFVDKENVFRHSKWLSFMEKRLMLARELLRDSGVIFISIDDNEQAQLKLLCDRIFEEKNFVCNFSWVNSNTINDEGKYRINGANAGEQKKGHEYILCFSKNKNLFKFNLFNLGVEKTLTREITKNGNNVSEITLPKGTTFNNKLTKTFSNKVGGTKETIYIKKGILDIKNGVLQSDVVLSGMFGERNIWIEDFLKGKEVYDTKGQKILDITITNTGVLKIIKENHGEIISDVISNVGSVADSTNKLQKLLNFELKNMFPKPINLIKYLLKISTKIDSVVLDFFAGSGTTGHAVLELNKEDGGHRQFILCTNNEIGEDAERRFKEKYKITEETFKLWKEENKDEWLECVKNNGICSHVCYPRIQKVTKGYINDKEEKIEGLGSNLNYFRTEFIDKDFNKLARETVLRDISNKCKDILKIKENVYQNVESDNPNFYSIIQGKDKIVGIYFNPLLAKEEGLKNILLKTDRKEKKMYCFTYGSKLEESIKKEWGNVGIEAIAIPKEIMYIYDNAISVIKKNTVPDEDLLCIILEKEG